MTTKISTTLLTFIICASIAHSTAFAGKSDISATVTDSAGAPIPGATVLLFADSTLLAGVATDAQGRFAFHEKEQRNPRLKISAVGYQTVVLPLSTLPSQVILAEKIVDVGEISVAPDRGDRLLSVRRQSSKQVQRAAQQSLVPTNPLAGIRSATVTRDGSAHSSQLRFNGTRPVYYLNDLPIGTDPTHFGSFAVLPSSVVDGLAVYPLGAPASLARPSVVQISTVRPFGQKRHYAVGLSSIDATGSVAMGNERTYVFGSLRKSVLDKLVAYAPVASHRRTIPPTNFEDGFLSAGVRFPSGSQLILDHYTANDYLQFQISSPDNLSSADTKQRTARHFTSLRLQTMSRRTLISTALSWRSEAANYTAMPTNQTTAVVVDLGSREETVTSRTELTTDWERLKMDFGVAASYYLRRNVDLHQQNWNFLPPFYPSDNPSFFQSAINSEYGEVHLDETSTDISGWTSLTARFGRWTITPGVRVDRFGSLGTKTTLSPRQQLRYAFDEHTIIELFAGAFAQSPVEDILQPYQVMIRAHQAGLSPVRTRLASLSLNREGLRFSVFAKRVDRMPILAPASAYPHTTDGTTPVNYSDPVVKSLGRLSVFGGALAYEARGILSEKIDFAMSYAYEHATRHTEGIITPYEWSAPHRFHLKADYRLNSRWSFGLSADIRSGFPYTPSFSPAKITSERTGGREGTTAAYQDVLTEENSLRFPVSAKLNLHAAYRTGNAEWYLNLSNVTNRANPIINTRSGFVYDAGILPTLGVRWRW